MGPPLPHTEVRIVDPVSLETVPVGERGELWARGYFTMIEYFDKPAETADTLLPDGWLRTGDLATMDERGYCRIVGRLKDMIIRGGENLFPAEIEEVLFRHPAVAEVAVVGLPDEKWGEVVAAFLRPADASAPPNGRRAACVPAGAPLTAEDAVEVVPRRRVPAHRFGEGPEVRDPRGVGEGPLRGERAGLIDEVPPMADLPEPVHVDEEGVDALLMVLLGSVLCEALRRETGDYLDFSAHLILDRLALRAAGPSTRRSGR